jgi:hypothetical protein
LSTSLTIPHTFCSMLTLAHVPVPALETCCILTDRDWLMSQRNPCRLSPVGFLPGARNCFFEALRRFCLAWQNKLLTLVVSKLNRGPHGATALRCGGVAVTRSHDSEIWLALPMLAQNGRSKGGVALIAIGWRHSLQGPGAPQSPFSPGWLCGF